MSRSISVFLSVVPPRRIGGEAAFRFSLADEVPRAGREEVVVAPARAFLRELLDEVGASVAAEGLPRPPHDHEGVSVLADELQPDVRDRFLLLRSHFRFSGLVSNPKSRS